MHPWIISLLPIVSGIVLKDSDVSGILNIWAENLKVEIKIVDNLQRTEDGASSFKFEMTLSHNDSLPITSDFQWSIYFYFDQGLLVNGAHVTRESIAVGQGLNVSHVDGDLWRWVVTDQWVPLEAGQKRTWTLNGTNWIVADSTMFPNWYFACGAIQSLCNPSGGLLP